MNRLPIEKRAQIIGMLVEGMSMRSVSRLVGCSINTVTKLLDKLPSKVLLGVPKCPYAVTTPTLWA